MPRFRRVLQILAVTLIAVLAGVVVTVATMTNATSTGSDSQEVSLLSRVGRSMAAVGVAIRDRRYAANRSDGSGDPDSVYWIDRTRSSRFVIVAPHAVNHHRDGEAKYADRYTGAIAELLANRLKASVLTTTGEVSDWGEDWDTRDDEFAEILHSLPDDSIIVDLHGMADNSTAHPISIGTGRKEKGPSMELAESVAEAFGGDAEINETFPARSSFTVTRHMQERGHDALQIEIAASLREPGALNVGYTLDALADAFQEPKTQSER